jgi:hypothetical protein
MIEPENQRAIAEVQAAVMMAKKFPRDIPEALERIKVACRSVRLAEAAVYSYPRGGTEVDGPSIRLAEVVIQNWGNAHFGLIELSQRPGESIMEAFCWDLETNVREVKIFTVPHVRFTRKGSYALTDPRDIYEMVANNGARRLRSCIQGIVPKDIMDEAVEICDRVMVENSDTTAAGFKKLEDDFGSIGVTRGQIEGRLNKKFEKMTPRQMVGLRKILNSVQDNMSKAADWFEGAGMAPTSSEDTGVRERFEKIAGENGIAGEDLEQLKRFVAAASVASQKTQSPKSEDTLRKIALEDFPAFLTMYRGKLQKKREREEMEAKAAAQAAAAKKGLATEREGMKAKAQAKAEPKPEQDGPFPDDAGDPGPAETVDPLTGEVSRGKFDPASQPNDEIVVCSKNAGDELTRGYCRTNCSKFTTPDGTPQPLRCPDFTSDSI